MQQKDLTFDKSDQIKPSARFINVMWTDYAKIFCGFSEIYPNNPREACVHFNFCELWKKNIKIQPCIQFMSKTNI